MEQPLTEARVHDMYRLLNECGEDTSCGCGCPGDDKPEPELKAASKKSKAKKQKLESRGLQAGAAIEEARRKIGLKTIRRLKKVHVIRGNRTPRVVKVAKMRNAVRKGASNNRHR